LFRQHHKEVFIVISIVKTSHRLALVAAFVLLSGLIGVVNVQSKHVVTGSTNELTAVIAENPDSLDPALTYNPVALQITSHIYETLVAADDSDQFRSASGLAESWTVSADGLTWTFNIRPGAKFHDSTMANADAVVYNFNRWWDPDHPFYVEDFIYFDYLFGGPKGDENSQITAVMAVGSSQVTIQLKAPDSNILAKLSFPGFGIASPQAIQTGTLDDSPVGSGPYKFATWQADQYIELAANQQWADTPEMEKLRFQIIPDPATQLAALKAGQAQASAGLQSLLDEVPMVGILRVKWHPASDIGYLGMNRAHAPLGNLLVRQAIAHAVNRQAIVANNYTAGDLVAKDLLPPQLWGADPNVEDYPYDPQKAKDLLKQAGYPNGFAITLSYRDTSRDYLPDPAATSAAIAANLEAVGIQVTVEGLESSEFFNKLNAGEHDLFLLGWTADYPHPYNLYGPILCSDYLCPQDQLLCDTLADSQNATSQAEQEALFYQASRRAHDTAPVLPIAHSRQPLVIYRDLFQVSYFWGVGADYATAVYADSHSYLPITSRGK
jgi:peptide/nickel transport system substrate-binding protein